MPRKPPDPEPSGSGLRLAAAAGAVAACALAYAVRWVPLGLCLYVAAVVAALITPPPEKAADPAAAAKQGKPPGRAWRAFRPAMRAWLPFGGCGGMWRLSPAGDSCLQERSENRWRPPLTYAALGSLCAAAGAVGADAALTMLLRDAPINADPSVSQWADVGNRALWVVPLSALFGWRLCRGWLWALRRVDAVAVAGTSEAPPETVAEEGPAALWHRVRHGGLCGLGCCGGGRLRGCGVVDAAAGAARHAWVGAAAGPARRGGVGHHGWRRVVGGLRREGAASRHQCPARRLEGMGVGVAEVAGAVGGAAGDLGGPRTQARRDRGSARRRQADDPHLHLPVPGRYRLRGGGGQGQQGEGAHRHRPLCD